MEPTLILDASGASALVAVSVDGKIFSRTCAGNTGQAGKLTAAIPEVLEEAGIATSDLKTLICGRGPGSFTGIRIALATAQGLISGLDSNCQFIGVDAFTVQYQSCLRLHNKVSDRDLLILIDSKRLDLFGLRSKSNRDEGTQPFLINIQEISDVSSDIWLTGDALARPDAPVWTENRTLLPINIEAIDLISATENMSNAFLENNNQPLYLRKPDVG